MSKLLDLLQRIGDGSPAPLGFGASRSGNLPGMALVGRVNYSSRGRRPRGLGRSAAASLDAAIVHGVNGAAAIQSLGTLLPDVSWGARIGALTEDEALACRTAGADLIAFGPESAAAALTGEDDLARIMAVAPDLTDRELRAVASLPVDIFVLDMQSVAGPWTVADLVKIGSISRRVDKYVLVEVGRLPDTGDLEALRDMGVNGLIVDAGNASAAALSGLKRALLEMPRPRSRRRERMRAAVPSAGFASTPAPSREDDDDDEYD